MPKQEIYTLIAGVITAIPLVHLWLHALMPFWKKHPISYYVFAGILFLASIGVSFWLLSPAYYLFLPTPFLEIIGWIFIVIGLILVLSAVSTLGWQRFFLLAIFYPGQIKQRRIREGIYEKFPHPAYIGWTIVSIGILIAGGLSHLLIPVISMMVLIPVVIILEEKELDERTK